MVNVKAQTKGEIQAPPIRLCDRTQHHPSPGLPKDEVSSFTHQGAPGRRRGKHHMGLAGAERPAVEDDDASDAPIAVNGGQPSRIGTDARSSLLLKPLQGHIVRWEDAEVHSMPPTVYITAAPRRAVRLVALPRMAIATVRPIPVAPMSGATSL